MAGKLTDTTKAQLQAALADLETARTQSQPQAAKALEAARAALDQYLKDQVPDVKATNAGGAVGSKTGTQGQGKGGGPGVLQIAPQDGASPRAVRPLPRSVRKAKLETALLRLRARS